MIFSDVGRSVLAGSVRDNTSYDFNDDGVVDLSFSASFRTFRFIASGPATTSLLRERDSFSGGPFALLGGFSIGPDNLGNEFIFSSLANGQGLLSFAFEGEGTVTGGPFLGQTAYLGFSFESDEGLHYGYALVDGGVGTGGFIRATAWENEPGKTILAGAIPEPSSLLLSSLGVLFLILRRR